MKILFILLSLLGLILLFRTKSRDDKISTYNKINKNDKFKDDKENKKHINEQGKNISDFIIISTLIDKIIYFKLFTVITSLITITILMINNIVEHNFVNFSVFGLITLTITLYIPKIVLKNIVLRRTEIMLKSLPFFIDITAACVQSGMTIDNSLVYTAKKFKLINSDLSLIVLKMTKRAELHGLESAIKEFHQYSSATEIRMFCSALQYSISFGSSVYEQLIKLSQDMREMHLLMTEEKISKLSAKLTFPLFIFILIPFIVLVISPSILEILTYVQKS
ncbi:type II secretion system F family protein [Yersinia proxima]|uniref:type II secretion system F family protein n=2 Tax=Yersinia proxima TaxID=2890316 RepID=UPI003D681C40